MNIISVKITPSVFSSHSKGKGSGNARSKMLKQIMPKFSGERGKRLEVAFAEKNKQEIFKIMSEITKELSS